jgi:kynurenine formamidase
VKVAALWEQLAAARQLDLSHPYRIGMPQSLNHPPFRMVIERRHGDLVRADGGSAANELLVLGGHVGTHIDALAHVSQDGLLHGGVPASSVQSNRGFSRLGVDDFPPYAGRAVLLDVSAVHGVDCLAPGYEITPDDLDSAQRRADVEIAPDEVILIGTGWSRNWSDAATFTGVADGVPGPGVPAAHWLARHRPRIVGSESIAFEKIAPGAGHAELPVHGVLLVEFGIHIMETMYLTELLAQGASEFGLVLAGLNVAGATGSPVRPLALLPDNGQNGTSMTLEPS